MTEVGVGAGDVVSPVVLALPGDPDTLTGGYRYDRRVADTLRRRGWPLQVLRLDDGFPFPDAAARTRAGDALAALPDGTTVLVDGLALGALPREAAREAGRLRLVALVHHPLALEEGLSREQALDLERSERDALAVVHHVIVTGMCTAATLRARYRVDGARITVAEPGTDPAAPARGSGGPGQRWLCVASVIPRKGHDLLLDALAPLAHRDWHLLCAGALDRDPRHARAVVAQAHALGLERHVTFAGEVPHDALDAHYAGADAFVLPTRLEGYGMALAEAVARGLPVVTSAGGAAAATVGAAAALRVPPGDRGALTAALERLLDDPGLRARLRAGARRRATTLPTWDDTADIVAGVLRRVAAR